MKRVLALWVVLAVLVVAPTAHAVVPSTMSYQGVLTDNSGNLVPDGLYNFTFRIWDAGAGGNNLWTETQNNIQVTKGGFSVVLGANTPMTFSTTFGFDLQYYLGISVNAAPELVPRIPLASSPYALSLRLPFVGVNPSPDNSVFSVRNALSGPDLLALGSHPAAFGAGGGFIHSYDSAGGETLNIEPDVDGGPAEFAYIGGSNGYLLWNGNTGSGVGGALTITGGSSTSIFNTDMTGDASVELPANAIDAGEILDEPGIAQNHFNGFVNFAAATGNSADILAVTINTPSSGYIVLSADAQLWMGDVAGQKAAVQITDVSGAAVDGNHYFYAGQSGGSVVAGFQCVSVHRTFFEGAAGSYTFYFQCQNASATGSPYAWNPTLTAEYFPTGYGTVTTAANPAELSQFEHVTRTTSAGNGPGQPPVSGALVDLRELELRAAKAQAQAEQARRALMEAQMNAQLGRSRSVSLAPVKK